LRKLTDPVVPEFVALQALLTAPPEGSVTVTVQPLTAAEPAETRTLATKPPFHELSETLAEQAPGAGGCGELGCGELGCGELGVGELGGVLGPPALRALRTEV
jgi:hypothetical protein